MGGFHSELIWEILFQASAAATLFFAGGFAAGYIARKSIRSLARTIIGYVLSIAAGFSVFYYLVPAGGDETWKAIAAGVAANLGLLAGYFAGTMIGLGGGGFEISFSKRITFKNHRSVTRLVVFLSVASIALGIMVMEISVSIVTGFQEEIQAKMVGFGSHIQIGNFLGDIENTLPEIPKENDFIPEVRNIRGVKSVSSFVSLPCMVKSPDTQQGVMMKGVDENHDFAFFQGHLKRGSIPDFGSARESHGILVSQQTASLLNVDTGDAVIAYFLRDKPRPRKVFVSGIYESGLEEFDKVTVLCDMRLLQRILDLPESTVMGFEVNLISMTLMDTVMEKVAMALPPEYGASSIVDLNPQMFDWLDLQHQQVWIIILMMLIIAVINMVSVILILILERTRTIGLLKTLGLPHVRIRRIFLFTAVFFIMAGILIGNAGGSGLLVLQDHFGWIKVSQENYFIREVPVRWVWDKFLVINICAIVISSICMILPARLVSSIDPVKAIRYD